MTAKFKKIIGWVALIVLVFALTLLIYTVLPGRTVTETIPVTPTYLIPPAAIP
jgi:hypothetical protein